MKIVVHFLIYAKLQLKEELAILDGWFSAHRCIVISFDRAQHATAGPLISCDKVMVIAEGLLIV